MPNPYQMTDEEKYYFDLRGYLIVRNALSRKEIDACNEAIDAYAHEIHVDESHLSGDSAVLQGKQGRLELRGMLGWPDPYRGHFRRQLVHPIVVSRLNELCGKRFRLDPALF